MERERLDLPFTLIPAAVCRRLNRCLRRGGRALRKTRLRKKHAAAQMEAAGIVFRYANRPGYILLVTSEDR